VTKSIVRHDVETTANDGELVEICHAAGLGGAADARVLAWEGSKIHPLLGAVHVAFAEHRPLVLSPDALWLTILQGVAQIGGMAAVKRRGPVQ